MSEVTTKKINTASLKVLLLEVQQLVQEGYTVDERTIWKGLTKNFRVNMVKEEKVDVQPKATNTKKAPAPKKVAAPKKTSSSPEANPEK